MEKLIITKIGGKVIDHTEDLNKFLEDFTKIPNKKMLIHGGGNIATQIAQSMGIQPNLIDGRRITDSEMLEVVVMVYAGLVNKKIVSKLQAFGTNALGLSGADANIITAKKREVKDIDYGFVGDIEKINSQQIVYFLNERIVPIIAPLTHDQQGNILNTNADTVAAILATALSQHFQTELFYCIDQPGLLKSLSNPNSIINKITWEKYQKYKLEGTVSEGMIPKMDTAFSALRSGVSRINICHANALLNVVKGNPKVGSELSI